MRKKAHRYTRDDYIFVYQMLLLRSKGTTYPEIGRMFNKHHSTIIYWCQRFNVDTGTDVPSPDALDWKISKKTVPKKFKYIDILEEHINPGKSYAEYLKEKDARSHVRPLPQPAACPEPWRGLTPEWTE
jgi:transposase